MFRDLCKGVTEPQLSREVQVLLISTRPTSGCSERGAECTHGEGDTWRPVPGPSPFLPAVTSSVAMTRGRDTAAPLSRSLGVHTQTQGHARKTPARGKGCDSACRGGATSSSGANARVTRDRRHSVPVHDAPRGQRSRRRGLRVRTRAHPPAAICPSRTPSPSPPGTRVPSARSGAGSPSRGVSDPAPRPWGPGCTPASALWPYVPAACCSPGRPDGHPRPAASDPATVTVGDKGLERPPWEQKPPSFHFRKLPWASCFQVHSRCQTRSGHCTLPLPPGGRRGLSPQSSLRAFRIKQFLAEGEKENGRMPPWALGEVVGKPSATPKEAWGGTEADLRGPAHVLMPDQGHSRSFVLYRSKPKQPLISE